MEVVKIMSKTKKETMKVQTPVEKNVSLELGMGWLPEYPDLNDYGVEKNEVDSRLKLLGQKDSVKAMIEKIGITEVEKLEVGNSIDLRSWCTQIEDQGQLGSCTAHAGVGLIEYYIKKVYGRELDVSRLFLYKTTRNLLGWSGDTGAFIRTTMGAMSIFGTPPERYWPYIIPEFDSEPPAFCYSYGKEFQAVQYFRLDNSIITKELLLKRIKVLLAAGLPSMFGFTVYNSIRQADNNDGKIPYPCIMDRVSGGHAVMAVGYDDDIEIVNTNWRGLKTKGALLIRNSWGENWGDEGYGWLPYAYVVDGLARDWWCLLKNEWVNAGVFGIANTIESLK
jgi:C1A family cysteine protease